MSSTLVTMLLKQLKISIRYEEKTLQVIEQYKGVFRNFSGNESLHDEEGRGWPFTLDNEDLQAIVEQKTYSKVLGKCLRNLMSAFQLYQLTI